MFQWIISGGQCCQCQIGTHPKETIDISANLDEGVDSQEPVIIRSEQEVALRAIGLDASLQSPSKEAQGGSPGEAAPSTPSTRSADDSSNHSKNVSPRMSEEECRAEKARLNGLVKTFLREAVVGVECKMLENRSEGGVASWEYIPAKLRTDQAMTKMVVQGGKKETMIKLIDVVETHAYEDLMDHLPKSQLGKNLREEDHSRAVFIQHRAPGLPESWLCLIVSDEETQERFITGIKVLRLRAEFNAKASKS